MGLTTKCNGGQTNVHITIQVFLLLFIYYNFMENISLNFFFIGFHTKSLLGGWALAYHMKSIFEI